MGTAARRIFTAALLFLPAPAMADPAPDAGPPGTRWKNAAVIGGIGLTVGLYGANGWWKDGFSCGIIRYNNALEKFAVKR